MSSDSYPQENSVSVKKLADGLLHQYVPHLSKTRNSIDELIAKQDKIYHDLNEERELYESGGDPHFQIMMEKIKFYREKLIFVKKQMASIHQRTKTLKTRAAHIQTCKEKEFMSKIEK